LEGGADHHPAFIAENPVFVAKSEEAVVTQMVLHTGVEADPELRRSAE
jgi:hypothetical protein